MLLVPAFSCRLVCSTGAIPAMRGSSSSLIASASLTVTVGPTGPRMRPPRPPPNEVVTVSRLVPRSVRLLVISRCTPAPTEVSVTTEETPMMIPRVVRIERMMFALMLRQARVNTSKAPRPARRDPFARSTALVVGLPRRALLIATRPNGRKLRLLPLVGLDQAVAQRDDPLRLLGDLRFVGDYYDRRALAVQLVEEPHYLLAGTGVEVAGRFVGEEQRRVHGEGAGDGYPLPLAAGELCGGVAVFLGQSHLLEELHRAGATLAPAHPGVPAPPLGSSSPESCAVGLRYCWARPPVSGSALALARRSGGPTPAYMSGTSTFSRMERRGSRWNAWNTKPM